MRPVASAATGKGWGGGWMELFRVRRGLRDWLFPDIRNMVSVNTSRGTDRVRSGRDRRVIATVMQVILH